MKPKSYYIIGGGIIGSTIARELLLKKKGDVTVLEKEDRLGEHASGRNSGVVHSGINQFPGSLKASMCLEGSKRLRQYCRDHNVPINECGTLVVARNKDEERMLYTLYGMGLSVGVPGLKIIGGEELESREPNVRAPKALLSPTGAIVESAGFLDAVSKEVEGLGGRYVFSSQVTGIAGNRIFTTKGEYEAGHIVNCAGLYSDKIAHMMNVGLEYAIIPFRGEYMEVKNIAIDSMVYQVPDLRFPFLSVHLTREIDGKVLGGPNAALSFGRESYEKQVHPEETKDMLSSVNFWRLLASPAFLGVAFRNAGISLFKSAFLKEIQKLAPAVTAGDITPHRAGIRAQMVDRRGKMLDDLVVEFCDTSTHVLNAVSPGMTSSFAFAEHVVSRMRV